ncbi:MAG: sporulation initiation factor Spo0A C-terminal domain-containing protein [Muricomes sp.]
MSNRKIFRKIAKENNVSVAEVKHDMQAAINHAYENAPNDGITKAYQNRVQCKGTVPTVDEFLAHARKELKK